MPPLVLCGVADDDHVAHVVATGRQLEARRAFTVRFVHVVPHTLGAMYAVASVAVASGTLATRLGVTDEHRAPPFMATFGVRHDRVDLLTGDPVDELPRRAERAGAALLVTGSRRRRPVSSALAGSVSRALIAQGSVPVLIASAVSFLEDEGPVLCGVAPFRAGTARIARLAAGFARRLERPLVLAAVLEGLDARMLAGMPSVVGGAAIRQESREATELLQRVACWLDVPRGVRVTVRVGAPSSTLADLAERESAVLLVVGCRSAGVMGTLLAGSISQELIRQTPRPVVVVPPQASR